MHSWKIKENNHLQKVAMELAMAADMHFRVSVKTIINAIKRALMQTLYAYAENSTVKSKGTI